VRNFAGENSRIATGRGKKLSLFSYFRYPLSSSQGFSARSMSERINKLTDSILNRPDLGFFLE
jgi:hypothetical protein